MEWQKLSSKEVPAGFRTFVSKKYRLPNGHEATYDIYDREGTVNTAVIALTKEGKVIVARQFRPGPEAIMEEIPGGVLGEGEAPEVGAKRELLEETGFTTDMPLESLGRVPRDAYSNAFHHYFLARNCMPAGNQKLDDGEYVEVTQISIADLIDNARKGRMTDPAAVLLALDKLNEIKKEYS